MKKILNYLTKKKVAVGLLSILLVVCLSAIAFMPTGKVNKVSASTSTAKIKIMSFNLRVAYTDTTPDGGEQAPNKRLPRIKKMLTDESPDIIGFQECTPYWETNLFNADPLTNYNYECMYRATGEEAAPIFWKKSKFTCLEQDSFWLSETPNVESLGWTRKLKELRLTQYLENTRAISL